MQAGHGLSVDRVIALSDEELARSTFDFIHQLDDSSDVIAHALYFLVDEILERFAPEVALAEVARDFRDGGADPDNLLDEIEGLRRRQAARLLRDTLEGGDVLRAGGRARRGRHDRA